MCRSRRGERWARHAGHALQLSKTFAITGWRFVYGSQCRLDAARVASWSRTDLRGMRHVDVAQHGVAAGLRDADLFYARPRLYSRASAVISWRRRRGPRRAVPRGLFTCSRADIQRRLLISKAAAMQPFERARASRACRGTSFYTGPYREDADAGSVSRVGEDDVLEDGEAAPGAAELAVVDHVARGIGAIDFSGARHVIVLDPLVRS